MSETEGQGAAAPAAAPAKAPAKKDPERARLIIRPYPKAVFFYPTAVCALVCAILTLTGAAKAQTLGFIFMCIFFFNLIVIAFEFTRYVSVAVVLTTLVLVLLGVQLNERLGLIYYLGRIYSVLAFQANAAFYFGVFGSLVITFIGIVIDTRFDYWELRGNEVLHHHGFLGDVERFPAPSLKLKKEITDVFEYLLLRSGRLVIFPAGTSRAIVLDNVPRINVLEEMITTRLHTLQVSIDAGQAA